MLKKAQLGKTGIEVTELCFGVLPMGPLQKDIPEEEAVQLLKTALQAGVTFFDTAELYKTQSYLGKALRGHTNPVVIATKSGSSGYEEMEVSVKNSLTELEREVIDIYHIHAARADESVFTKRAGAIKCLLDYKAQGKIKAVGISTHNVGVVRAAAKREDIDVIFMLINKAGRGVMGGTVTEMVAAIEEAAAAGKGIYAMKALGGGHLINDQAAAFDFVRTIKGMQAIAVGMTNSDELKYNVSYFSGEEKVDSSGRLTEMKKLLVSAFCIGCGTCARTCPSSALSIVEGKAVVDHSRCVLCGYCSAACPEFAIRVV